MYSIEYFPFVRDDLREIENYLDEIDPGITDKVLIAIQESIQSLDEMPFRYPEYVYRPDYRVVSVYNYMIFYVVAEDRKVVEVRRILHSARNLAHELYKI